MIDAHGVEKAVLGAMLIDPECIDDVLAKTSTDMFTHPDARDIYVTIWDLHSHGKGVDLVSVGENVRNMEFLANCTTVVPTSANVDYYIELLKKYWIHGRAGHWAEELTDLKKGNADPEEFGTTLSRAMIELETGNTETYVPAKTMMKATVEQIEKHQGSLDITGVPSGLKDLDEMLDGFQDGDFIIIGARPSQGKSALALKILLSAAQKEYPVGFFSLEMGKASIGLRLSSMISGVEFQRIRKNFLNPGQERRVAQAIAEVSTLPMYIYDKPNDGLYSVVSMAKKMIRQEQIKCIIIDYLSLINVKGPEPRHEKVAIISRTLKALARDMDVPVIALSQLTRDTEGKQPKLNSIRESGAVEQDADVVVFIHADKEDDETRDLIIAKQRNGPTGRVVVHWKKDIVRFDNQAKGGEI